MFVYKITNIMNDKAYIGITIYSVAARFKKHLWLASRNEKSALYAAIRKYGWNVFSCETIAEAASLKELKVLERGLIAAHGTYSRGGYNMTLGGDGVWGYKPTPEQIAKATAANLGRKQSNEEREKRAASLRGKKQSPEHIAKRIATRISRGGCVITPEGRARWLSSMRGRRMSDEERARRAVWQNSPEFRAKQSVAHKGKPGNLMIPVEIDRKIKELLIAGASIQAILDQTGVTRRPVLLRRRRLIAAGLVRSRAQMLKDGDSNGKIGIRLTHQSESLTISEWSARLGISKNAIEGRLKLGWSIGEIISTPIGKKRAHPTAEHLAGLFDSSATS